MGNRLEQLPDRFGDLSGLYRLGLKSNGLRQLPGSFTRLTNLVELFITDNKLTELPEGGLLGPGTALRGVGRCMAMVGLREAGGTDGRVQLLARRGPLPSVAAPISIQRGAQRLRGAAPP